MLYISLVVCALVLIAANLAARRSLSDAAATSAAGIVVSCLCGFAGVFLPAAFLSAFLLVLVAAVCWFRSGGPGMFLKYSLGAVVGVHVLITLLMLPDLLKRDNLRQRYPTESMTERLAYETRGPTRPASSVAGKERPPLALSAAASSPSKSLDELENRISDVLEEGSSRNTGLYFLHESTVEDFINSPGFGVTRAIEGRSREILLPEIESVPLPSPDYVPDTGTGGSSPAAKPATTTPTPPAQDELTTMHEKGITEFVNPQGFGYIKDRQHVKGFQSHHFRSVPRLADSWPGTDRWIVQSLELVSLLKHEEPVAYLSKNLPRMDELRDAPTRPLDSFEKSALAALQSGEDLQVDTAADQIRMLGSIRAVKQCLACHRVTRGELLGAFSYTLRRARLGP
jgi:hypothetical protein